MYGKRGLYFDSARRTEWRIDDFDFNKSFSVAMWVRPEAGGVAMFGFAVDRLTYNGEFYISSCNSVSLLWVETLLSTSANAVGVNQWSFNSFSAKAIGYATDLIIYVNGEKLAQTVSHEQIQVANMKKRIGSADNVNHRFHGYIWSFDYYEFANAATTVNKACEDANFDGTPDCDVCLGNGSCLGNCGASEWNNAGTCTTCSPAGNEVCNGSGTAVGAGCGTCACVDYNNSTTECAVFKSSANRCARCNPGYEFQTFPGSACVACTGVCKWNSGYIDPEICSCISGQYYNDVHKSCLACAGNCKECVDGTALGCTKCKDS
jgi:hypothetical protein